MVCVAREKSKSMTNQRLIRARDICINSTVWWELNIQEIQFVFHQEVKSTHRRVGLHSIPAPPVSLPPISSWINHTNTIWSVIYRRWEGAGLTYSLLRMNKTPTTLWRLCGGRRVKYTRYNTGRWFDSQLLTSCDSNYGEELFVFINDLSGAEITLPLHLSS